MTRVTLLLLFIRYIYFGNPSSHLGKPHQLELWIRNCKFQCSGHRHSAGLGLGQHLALLIIALDSSTSKFLNYMQKGYVGNSKSQCVYTSCIKSIRKCFGSRGGYYYARHWTLDFKCQLEPNTVPAEIDRHSPPTHTFMLTNVASVVKNFMTIFWYQLS